MIEFGYRSFGDGLVDADGQNGSATPARRHRMPPTLPFFCADLAALALAFLVTFGLGWLVTGSPASTALLPHIGLMSGLTLLLFALTGLYRRGLSEVEEVRRIVLGCLFLMLTGLGLRLLSGLPAATLWQIAVWPAFAGLALTGRTLLRALPAMRRALTTHVILLGRGDEAETLMTQMSQLRSNPVWPVSVLRSATLSDLETLGQADLSTLIGREAYLAGIAPRDLLVMLVPGPGEADAAATLSRRLDRLGQPYCTPLAGSRASNRMPELVTLTGIGGLLMRHQTHRPESRLFKRGIDILGATLLLTLLAPSFLITIALIRRDGGDAFFAQKRVGRDGRRFHCLKFRSMYPDAEARLLDLLENDADARAEWKTHQKLRVDPRVTPIGRYLRQTSLDELPQLINVLKGEMSFVGPRPIIAPEVPGYAGDHAYYHGPAFPLYAACTPGITGLWQVSGRASTTHDERIRLDSWYARNWSLWLDIVILLRTIGVLIRRTGS